IWRTCSLVVEKNARDSALSAGRLLVSTTRSMLVKNRLLRSRLSGIWLRMVSSVCIAFAERSNSSGRRSCAVVRIVGMYGTYTRVGVNESAMGGGGFGGMSMKRYESPVTGLLTIDARNCGN